MTDFVLEVKNNIENDWLDSDRVEELKKIIKYAEFLKQPLKLGMFFGKEKLFSNAEIIEDEGETWIFHSGKYRFRTSDIIDKTIEDLSWSSLELTPNAIKQIGL